MPSPRPRVVLVTRAFVKRHDGRLLAIRRSANESHHAGLWECPGGKLDQGQDIAHAQEREVIEETGYFVTPVELQCFADSYVIGDGAYKGLPYVVLFSVCRLVGGIKKLSDEHSALKWVSYRDFLDLNLTPEVRKAAIGLAKRLR
ncbi:MAG: NUDIX domain-containing protein [bacterium]